MALVGVELALRRRSQGKQHGAPRNVNDFKQRHIIATVGGKLYETEGKVGGRPFRFLSKKRITKRQFADAYYYAQQPIPKRLRA